MPLYAGGSFSGHASARASYGSLDVEAQGILVGEAVNVDATSAAAAAFFDDFLTASGASVAAHSTVFVCYVFEIDGSLSVPAQRVAYHPGYSTMLLNYQHAGGPIFGAAQLAAQTAELGYYYALDGDSSSWSFGVGSVTRSGRFRSSLAPIEYGASWELQVGMLAQTLGEGAANFLATGRLVDAEFYDAAQQRLTGVDLVGSSGARYFATAAASVPEPQSWALTMLGLVALAATRRRALEARRG